MTSTDDHGFVKYWQANLNNVHTFQAHNDPVRSSRWDSLSSSLLVAFLFHNNTFVIVLINKLCQTTRRLFHYNDKVYGTHIVEVNFSGRFNVLHKTD